MRRLIIFYLVVILLLFFILAFPEEQPADEILPVDFSNRVFDHIVYLAGLGHRQVGTENDSLAIQYIRDQFETMGLDVKIQSFEFESFEYTNVSLEIGDKQFDVVGLGFNPYKNKQESMKEQHF
jgi:hypothetical protein